MNFDSRIAIQIPPSDILCPARNNDGRITHHDGIVRDVFHRHRASSDDCALSNRHAGPNECIGADPGIVANCNWRLEQRHVGLSPVMRTSAEMRTLRNRSSGANTDWPQRIKDRPVSDSTLIAQSQVPRDRDAHCRINIDCSADFGPKHA